MLFKAITIVPYADPETARAFKTTRLSDLVGDNPVGDPSGSQWAVVGFSKPDYFGETIVFEGSDGTLVLNVEVRERLLPSKVIKTKLQDKIDEMVRRAGRKLNRKEIAQLKDEVVLELLPTAFIKSTSVLVLITAQHLIVGTQSARQVDSVLALLHRTFRETPIAFKWLERDTVKWMTSTLLDDPKDDGFDIGKSAVLKNGDSVIRFKEADLSTYSRVTDYLVEGYRVQEMALTWDSGNVEFTLNDKLTLRKLNFSNMLISDSGRLDADDAVAQFDCDVALTAGTLKHMLADLLAALPGKPAESEQADAAETTEGETL